MKTMKSISQEWNQRGWQRKWRASYLTTGMQKPGRESIGSLKHSININNSPVICRVRGDSRSWRSLARWMLVLIILLLRICMDLGKGWGSMWNMIQIRLMMLEGSRFRVRDREGSIWEVHQQVKYLDQEERGRWRRGNREGQLMMVGMWMCHIDLWIRKDQDTSKLHPNKREFHHNLG